MLRKSNAKYPVEEVFTPGGRAELTFVERGDIERELVAALRTPGKQIVIYGPNGSGKTTLLANILSKHKTEWVKTICYSGLTFEQLLQNGFDGLETFYESSKSHNRSFEAAPSLGAEYFGIKAQLTLKLSQDAHTEHQRLLSPQLKPQTLARFLGHANRCWILDDFDKIAAEEKVKLAQVMKVFMEVSSDHHFKNLKIIAIGAEDTPRQVVQYDRDMRNRVAELYVPLMTPQELGRIIDKGEALLNFRIPPSVKIGIVRYSNGLAIVCHQLCLNICFAAELNETLPELKEIKDYILENALELYLKGASKTLKDAFVKGFRRFRKSKFDNSRLILQALVRCGQDGATAPNLLKEIRRTSPDYPRGNLLLYLRKLQTSERGELIRFDPISGSYSFSDPIYFAYALTTFEREKDFDLDLGLDKENLIKSIKALLHTDVPVAIGFLESIMSHGTKKAVDSESSEPEPDYDRQLYINKE